ncbi:TetR/AcrR family transcriptional regulator [Rhodococcus sp. HNM0569]|uniref:TetR family transcriptional regulator n=1 Tax=Rhodococcus sp. HNM0569 TaxID=2716340 RepID=UPI00146F4746|nr:helix-turn-helix transcriptional regulator [Rhodococcus sp. HNM0569]
MRADARANRAAVVAAARRLIAAQGAGASLTAIAEEAGVGIATLYRHFPTREDLLYALAVDARDRIVAITSEHAARADTHPIEWWESCVRALAALRPGVFIAEAAGAQPAGTELETLGRVRADMLAAVDSVLALAKQRGLARDDVTPVHFQLGLARITRPLPVDLDAPPFDADEFPGAEEHERWLVDVYLRGLRP